jgi:hypothetical protein
LRAGQDWRESTDWLGSRDWRGSRGWRGNRDWRRSKKWSSGRDWSGRRDREERAFGRGTKELVEGHWKWAGKGDKSWMETGGKVEGTRKGERVGRGLNQYFLTRLSLSSKQTEP